MKVGDVRVPVPQPPGDGLDYSDPLSNRIPAASSVTSFPQLGLPSLWICERENLLATVTEHMAPFDTVSIPPGMNRTLTQDEADLLNARYPTP